jgi:hypothetical protein
MTDQHIHLTPKPVAPKDVPNSAKTPAETEKLEEQQRDDHIADKAAEQAGNREQRYDQDHGLITK